MDLQLWWQDGMTWLLGNPDESLGYILADSGFDVWIANTRGTQYSLNHQYLDPKKKVSFLIFLYLISISPYILLNVGCFMVNGPFHI